MQARSTGSRTRRAPGSCAEITVRLSNAHRQSLKARSNGSAAALASAPTRTNGEINGSMSSLVMRLSTMLTGRQTFSAACTSTDPVPPIAGRGRKGVRPRCDSRIVAGSSPSLPPRVGSPLSSRRASHASRAARLRSPYRSRARRTSSTVRTSDGAPLRGTPPCAVSISAFSEVSHRTLTVRRVSVRPSNAQGVESSPSRPVQGRERRSRPAVPGRRLRRLAKGFAGTGR